MKILRKFEQTCIHKVREEMLSKYPKTCKLTIIWFKFQLVIIGSFTFITFMLDITRGKMKNYNRFYESNYKNPLRLGAFIAVA